jgi:4,5-dihydroxyphthalate decarboxylase
MARLKLTFACGSYDRMIALRTGDVPVEGIDLNFLAIESPREIFDRMGGGLEFDLSEFSSSEFISMLVRGNSPFVALPVFPSRVFRHSYIYVNKRAGIRTPKDLEGKRVGVALYTQSAAVWIRGHLQNEYGVDLSTIRWVQGAIEKAGTHGKPHAPPLLKPVTMEINDTGRSLGDLLAEGKLDAVAGARRPAKHHTDVVPLFSDAKAVERAYYLKTKIHPIMHLVAMRRDVYEANPWIASSLYKAFVASKRWALDRLHQTGAHACMLPWLDMDVDEIDEVFGGDPWPYGVEANRPTLEALVAHLTEQHFIPRPLPIEEIFVPLAGLTET